MKKFVIDRSKWKSGDRDRGGHVTGNGRTDLLNPEGFSCCLGLLCLDRGISPDVIKCRTTPLDLHYDLSIEDLEKIPELIDKDSKTNVWNETDFSSNAMRLNDNGSITSTEREVKLKKLFMSVDIELEFVNEYKMK